MSGYSATELLWLVGLLAGVTLVARNLFLVLPRRWQPRGTLERALRAAPLAALVAITVPEVVRGAAAAGVDPLAWATDPRLISAAVLAAVWAWRRHGLTALGAAAAAYLGLLVLTR
ncbi:MAG: AzlD domain-containing protein [Rubrivivax sp.]|jgi:branched-subunit amino acid transport protein|nr:AzlD domain-containing protein [Rubrivivax sp.]